MNGVKRNRQKLSDTASLAIPSIETVEEIPVFIAAPHDRAHLLVLLAALVIGFGLMVPALRPVPLAMDEYGTYWIMSDENPLTLMERSLQYENIPPLSPLVRRVFFQTFGQNEFAFRLPFVVWYLLTIGAVYLLGRDLLGKFPGALAALVCALHQNVLGEVTIARCYGLGLLLATLSYWVTVRWMRSPRQIGWAMAWTALSSALVWTHYLNVAVTLSQAVVLAYAFFRQNIHVKAMGIVAVAAYVASMIPLLPAIFRMAQWGSSFGFQGTDPIWRILIPLWWLGLPAGALVGWLLSRKFRAPTLSAIPRSSFVVLLLWGLLPPVLASIVCRDDFASLSNPRYRIGFAGPAACLIAGLLCHRRSRGVALLSVITAIVFAWLPAPRAPWSMKRLGAQQSHEWKDMALQIEERGAKGEPIFVQSGLGEGFLIPGFYLNPVFLDYAACRLGRFYCKTEHPRIGLPFLWDSFPEMQEHYAELARKYVAENHKTLWLAGATDTDLNVRSISGFDKILTENGFRLIEQTKHHYSVLLRYEHQSAK
ncbi:hypothetical protein Pan44_47410 [Caulifigura coniformis]|uniref:Glycosyltransferase RgtA/B/C/D-like domain-containing protein n=1 Tax=Caulifigura coniformis TaxID=2527983 RepID=A0A517SKP5_9PLAN|nr:glycosyltransferase family 39 protein [Caulifigura coniformis]QDT56684.1 hypothetical protein Pan44_47410 [Caulifigura coniformis]